MAPRRASVETVFTDHTELFVALVAAVGTDQTMVTEQLETLLTSYAYTSETLRLSDYLAEQAQPSFRGKPLDEEIWEAMTAGDELRQKWDRNDALALQAIGDVVAIREERVSESTSEPVTAGNAEASGNPEGCGSESTETDAETIPPDLFRHAFIIRSLKTPGELETLRSVYGERLVVIGVYSPRDVRIEHLHQRIKDSRKNDDIETWVHKPIDLIERDEKEELKGGQDVSGTFHRADFFIRGWDRQVVREDLERALEILFGSPFRTPTRDEYGQFLAAGAALRSAEFGRQVGAAVSTPEGSVIALGANEVPIAGGGSRWEEDDGPGNRDFEIGDIDTNRRNLDELVDHVADAVEETVAEALTGFDEAATELQQAIRNALPSALRAGGIKDLTEFGRAVHAEMNAILDAARRGVPVTGATLYTTTFPCHNCARHIIGGGITRVVYIEPYGKSRAADLHEESVSIEESQAEEGDSSRVVFEPFIGVAPRRYLDLFDAGLRERLRRVPRARDGRKQDWDREQAAPILPEAGLPDLIPEPREYRARELLALDYYEQLLGES